MQLHQSGRCRGMFPGAGQSAEEIRLTEAENELALKTPVTVLPWVLRWQDNRIARDDLLNMLWEWNRRRCGPF